jgi:hypothetical protein
MTAKPSTVKRTITIFSLAMINVAAIGSVKNWPVTAEYGLASVFYLLLGAIVFFLPIFSCHCRTCDRLAKRRRRLCMGQRSIWSANGILAIWLYGLKMSSGTPTVLSFIAATIAYIF